MGMTISGDMIRADPNAPAPDAQAVQQLQARLASNGQVFTTQEITDTLSSWLTSLQQRGMSSGKVSLSSLFPKDLNSGQPNLDGPFLEAGNVSSSEWLSCEAKLTTLFSLADSIRKAAQMRYAESQQKKDKMEYSAELGAQKQEQIKKKYETEAQSERVKGGMAAAQAGINLAGAAGTGVAVRRAEKDPRMVQMKERMQEIDGEIGTPPKKQQEVELLRAKGNALIQEREQVQQQKARLEQDLATLTEQQRDIQQQKRAINGELDRRYPINGQEEIPAPVPDPYADRDDDQLRDGLEDLEARNQVTDSQIRDTHQQIQNNNAALAEKNKDIGETERAFKEARDGTGLAKEKAKLQREIDGLKARKTEAEEGDGDWSDESERDLRAHESQMDRLNQKIADRKGDKAKLMAAYSQELSQAHQLMSLGTQALSQSFQAAGHFQEAVYHMQRAKIEENIARIDTSKEITDSSKRAAEQASDDYAKMVDSGIQVLNQANKQNVKLAVGTHNAA